MKIYSIEDDGITQSLMAKYMTCPRMFKIATLGWSSPEKMVMVLGTQGHRFIEAYHKNEEPSFEFDPMVTSRDEQELIEGVISALIPVYVERWKEFDAGYRIKPEIVFDIPFCCTRLRGKIDAIYTTKTEIWLKETKFKNRISEDDLERRLSIDWQANFYAHAYQLLTGKTVKGFIYDVVRYPSLKGTAKELHDDILRGTKKEPDHWFKRWCVELSAGERAEFATELVVKINELRTRTLFYRNHCACASGFSVCKYIDVCTRRSYAGLVLKELFNELK